MEEKTIKLYDFEELEEDTQEKVLEKHRRINVDNMFWFDYLLEDFVREAKDLGFKIEKDSITFDLYGQGQHFSADIKSDFSNVLKNYQIYGRIFSGNRTGTIKSWNNNLEFIPEELWKGGEEITEDDKRFEEITEKVEAKLYDLRDLMKDYKKKLQEEYRNQTSNEAIKETFEINEIKFRENGRIE